MKYKPTIGLEIHAELDTKTKMFCRCLNDADETKPNTNVCPLCMGHPGSLPVANKEAIKSVLRTGKALGAKLADYTQFDRKNYFYPDLPKGYQISQYQHPLVEGGELNGVLITRIHLEEDTGSSSHKGDYSYVDYNRSGVPLMELVTEPVISTGVDARKFAEEFQLILRYLGVSDADMEKGQMRIEANISVSDTDEFGTKVEIKNLNSFRAVEQAIDFEIKRQSEALEKGEIIIQETRGWDENKQITFSQRKKESSHDYRYFPEPDLPTLKISEFNFELLIPELPEQKRERFLEDFGLRKDVAETLIQDKKLADYFENIASNFSDSGDAVKLVSNYITSDLLSLMKEKSVGFRDVKISAENFGKLIKLVSEKKITSRVAKDILRTMFEEEGDPIKIVEEKGLEQVSDESVINDLVEQLVKDNPQPVQDYKDGKEPALKFLVGQGMKLTRGSTNPVVLEKALKQRIS